MILAINCEAQLQKHLMDKENNHNCNYIIDQLKELEEMIDINNIKLTLSYKSLMDSVKDILKLNNEKVSEIINRIVFKVVKGN